MMSILSTTLPVVVTMLPFVLIIFVIFLFDRHLAKKVATIMGVILAILVVIIIVVELTQGTDSRLDTSEKATVLQAAERNFKDNYMRIDVPTKKAPPFTKAKYVIVVRNYESQDNVDYFIQDACDKLKNKNTSLMVQPIQQTASQPKLTDRTCDAL